MTIPARPHPYHRPPPAAALLFALTSCTCNETVTPDLPVCPALRIAAPTGEPPQAAVWLSLLLPDYDPDARRAPDPALNCAGLPVAAPPDPCTRVPSAYTPVPTLDDHALVFQDTGDGHLLLWIKTHRAPSGDALGPVALVESSPTTLAVRALGMLEAPPEGTVLALLATADRRYLVAEGERCSDTETCTREARILALDGPTFVPSAYYDANAVCIEPPRLPLFRRAPHPGDPTRTVVDRRLIVTDERGLIIQEELEFFVGDQLLRRSAESRRVDFRGGRLVVDTPSLWSRLAAQAAPPMPPESPA